MKIKLAFCLLALTPFAFVSEVNAQTKGMEGSYFGSTLDSNTTEGLLEFFETNNSITPMDIFKMSTGEAEEKPSQLQGRFDFPTLPVSIRGTAYSSGEAKAIMPVISYDVGINNNTNIYAGAGYAFVKTNGEDTPLGDRDGLILTTGIEAKIVNNIVFFGDAKLMMDAESMRIRGTDAPVKLQFGIGYGF